MFGKRICYLNHSDAEFMKKLTEDAQIKEVLNRVHDSIASRSEKNGLIVGACCGLTLGVIGILVSESKRKEEDNHHKQVIEEIYKAALDLYEKSQSADNNNSNSKETED